ncbi:hypothetical protein [Streptomyces sp. NPDC056242]|uniref:hypothetical protein n=1 Tax=Streptomyces TaxID=1883 RepID=UPI0035DE62AA
MQIVVAGQGYVGLPLAVRAVEVGHRVIGYDVNSRTRLQVKSDSPATSVGPSRSTDCTEREIARRCPGRYTPAAHAQAVIVRTAW